LRYFDNIAQEVAERIAEMASRRGFRPECEAMDDIDLAVLPKRRRVVFIASTTGDGEVPDNMQSFWAFLRRSDLPPASLSGLKMAVFGLGDSTYEKFNAAARMLCVRLQQLGATEMCERGLGDDSSEQGVEGDLEMWLKAKLWPSLQADCPLPAGVVVSDAPILAGTRYTVRRDDSPKDRLPTDIPAGGPSLVPAYCGGFPALTRSSYRSPTRAGPMQARLVANERVTAPLWEQNTRFLRFELPRTAPSWKAGDVAVVWPRNDGDGGRQIETLIHRMGARIDDKVIVSVPESPTPSTAVLSSRSSESAEATEVLDFMRRVFRNPNIPSALDKAASGSGTGAVPAQPDSKRMSDDGLVDSSAGSSALRTAEPPKHDPLTSKYPAPLPPIRRPIHAIPFDAPVRLWDLFALYLDVLGRPRRSAMG